MATADIVPIAGSDSTVTGSDSSVVRTISACVLIPIAGAKAAGEDVRSLKLWVDLRNSKPKVSEGSEPSLSDWERYGDLVEEALCTKSKDLELGVFLVEARTRVQGFAGARDGFWMLSGLIEEFADQGLFPEVIDEDLETQYSPLYWLNEKFPDVLHELELTRRQGSPNYSWNYLIEANAPNGGMITKAEWDDAAMAGNVQEYETLLGTIKEAQSELARLKQIVTARYGAGVLSFNQTEETLAGCSNVVEGFVRRLRGEDVAAKTGGASSSVPDVLTEIQGNDAYGGWLECEKLARSGKVDQALSRMVALAAAEPNGRIRFQRKLLLADLCLQTNRKKLGTSILQELHEIIEKHRLEEWETTEMVGGVWSRLVRCYRDRTAGTADESRETEFYNRLSRLDPWQALICGEPAKRE